MDETTVAEDQIDSGSHISIRCPGRGNSPSFIQRPSPIGDELFIGGLVDGLVGGWMDWWID